MVKGPDDAEWRYPVKADANGSLHYLFDEKTQATGLYQARIELDGHQCALIGFKKDAYRLPRFQVRFDATLRKEFQIGERARLRLNFDAFNLFNHPDFDTPNNDVTFFPNYSGPPQLPPEGSLGIIQHTLGSSRFLQLALHLSF